MDKIKVKKDDFDFLNEEIVLDDPTLERFDTGLDVLMDPSEPPESIDIPLSAPLPTISYTPLVEMMDVLNKGLWTTTKVDAARKRLDNAILSDPLNPPNEAQVQENLNEWWFNEGFRYPRHILDQIGIKGGAEPKSFSQGIIEASRENTRVQVQAVKDILQPQSEGDPLQSFIESQFIADPSSLPGDGPVKREAELKDRVEDLDDESVDAIKGIIDNNVSLFDNDVASAVNFEVNVRDKEEKFFEFMQESAINVGIVLWGTDFFNRLGADLPGFLDRKQGKGELSENLEAISRIRTQVVNADPSLAVRFTANFGDVAAELVWFALLPNPGKIVAFKGLSPAAKGALNVGSKAGLTSLLKAQEQDETLAERAAEVATATGIGVLTGATLGKLFDVAGKTFDRIKTLKVEKQADTILFNNPDLGMTKQEVVSILTHLKSTSPEQFAKAIGFRPPPRPVVSRVIKGLRPGFAEIEKPGKIIKKAITAAAKTKEGTAVQIAKEVLKAAKALSTRAVPVKPAKPAKILTKAEAATFRESNLVTGEDVDIKIVADPATRRAIDSTVKEVAKLKTQKSQLQADKKVALTKAKEVGKAQVQKTKAIEIEKKVKAVDKEISKRESSIESLKEKFGIKLETTIEGFRAKADKINKALEFKQEMRNDALSLIQGVPADIRNSFISRAMKIGTKSQRPETSLKKVRELAQEAQVGIDNLEKKIVIKDFKKVAAKVRKNLATTPEPHKTRLKELLDSVDLVSLSNPKKKDLLSLQGHVKRLALQLAGNLEALDPAVEQAVKLPDKRVRELLRLSQDNVKDMGIDDIKFILNQVQQVANEAKLKGKLLRRKGLQKVKEPLKSAPSEIKPTIRAKVGAKREAKGKAAKKKTNLQKGLEGFEKFVRHDEAQLTTLAEATGSESMIEILDTDPHIAMRNIAGNVVELTNQAGSLLKQKGMNSFKDVQTKHEVVLAGKRVTVTMDDLVGLEMDTRSPSNLNQRLTAEGINIGDHSLTYTEGIDRLKEINDAVAIVRASKPAMALADTIEEMTPLLGEMVQPTHQLRFGHNLPLEPNYYPRQRVGDRRVSGPDSISRPVEAQGRYQQRTGGVKPLRVVPGTEALLDGIEMDSWFADGTLPLRNMRIMLEDKGVVASMKANGREAELNEMIEIVRRTQGVVTSRDTFEVFGKNILNKFTGAVLGARISTRGTQIMSFPAAMAETGPQAAKIVKLYSKEDIARIEEDSALMLLRWKAKRISIEVGLSASEEAFNMLFFDKVVGIRNKSMTGLTRGDQQAVANIYYQLVVPELLNKPRSGKAINAFAWEGRTVDVVDLPEFTDVNSPEFRYAAARRLEYVVRRTQPMFDILDRSTALSTQSLSRRLAFGMFRTALSAQENILMRSVNQFLQNPSLETSKKLTGDFAAVTAANFAVAIWKRGLKWAIGVGATSILSTLGVFKFRNRREKKEILSDIAKDTAKNVIRTSVLGKMIVTTSEIAADRLAGEGYNWNREPVDNPLADVLDSGVDFTANLAPALTVADRLSEFVTEASKGSPLTSKDIKFNDQLIEDVANDIIDAARSTYTLGAYAFGAPILAPVQEFVVPFFRNSKIKIIREVDFGDIDNPQDFSQRTNDLFEKRSDLNSKSKKERLSPEEERRLAILNNYANLANRASNSLKDIADKKERKRVFKQLMRSLEFTEKSTTEKSTKE